MKAIDLMKRPISSVVLALTLSLPIVGSGCAAEVGDSEEVIDDSTPEVDETSVKEDSRVRPHGRFQVPEFEMYREELDARLGYTYALEVFDHGRGIRDYGVSDPDGNAQVGRRDVSVKFTRSGSKRYIRLTDSTSDENEVTVRYEYKMSRGNLRLRAENSTRWFTMEPSEPEDAEYVEQVRELFAFNQDQVDESEEASEGLLLPFNVELEVDRINHVWGDDYPAVVHIVNTEVTGNWVLRLYVVYEDNDGGGERNFFTRDGVRIARATYSESSEFNWEDL